MTARCASGSVAAAYQYVVERVATGQTNSHTARLLAKIVRQGRNGALRCRVDGDHHFASTTCPNRGLKTMIFSNTCEEMFLVEVTERRIEREPALNRDARDLVLRRRAWLHRPRSAESRREAQRAFERALELDALSVDANIGLATALISNVLDGWSTSSQQDEARAGQLLRKALEHDMNRPMAHLAMGLLCRLQNRLVEARIEFETAIALDRNFPNAYRHLGITLMHLGEPDAGIPYIERAIRLNPRDPNVAGHYWAFGRLPSPAGPPRSSN
jgi:tetratricopeptide (TPR) repeat protein